MEYELVTLEDGKEYLILKEEIIDNIKYLYLINSKDDSEYAIRKEINDELVGLTDEEFERITEKILNDGENMF